MDSVTDQQDGISKHNKFRSTIIYDMDQAYELAGGRGKYQFLVALECWISMTTMMLFIYCVPMFLIEPNIQCYQNFKYSSCDKQKVCNNPGIQYKFDKPHDFNFITEFGLLCKDYEKTFIISAAFLASLVSCIFVNLISDIIGRLPCLVFGNMSNLILVGIVTLIASYKNIVIISALIGLTTIINASCSYTFIYDSFPTKYATFYGTTVNIAWGVAQTAIPLIMMSQIKWRIMCWIIVGVMVISIIPLIWIRESPYFYYFSRRCDKALKLLYWVAKVNGRELPKNLVLVPYPDPTPTDSPHKVTKMRIFKTLCCNFKMVARIFIMSFCNAAATLLYYAVSLNVEKMGGNIYINAITMGIYSTISGGLCGIIYAKIGKKTSIVLFFAMATLGVLLQGFFWNNPRGSMVGIFFSSFGSNAAISCLYLLVAILYPDSIKSTALGISVFFTRLVSIFSTPLSLLSPLGMCIFLAAINIVSGILAIFIPIKKRPAVSKKTTPNIVKMVNNANDQDNKEFQIPKMKRRKSIESIVIEGKPNAIVCKEEI